MISLLYRADDLGFLTPYQKTQLIQRFNELQIRRREPLELDMPVESPKLVRLWLAKLKAAGRLSTTQLAAKLHLHSVCFVKVYLYSAMEYFYPVKRTW